MKNDVKDVVFCPQGNHMVPRDQMTKMLNDNGKSWRRVCIECKEATYERRKRDK